MPQYIKKNRIGKARRPPRMGEVSRRTGRPGATAPAETARLLRRPPFPTASVRNRKKKRAEALFSFSETDRQFISGWHNSTGNRILRHPHSGGCGMFRPCLLRITAAICRNFKTNPDRLSFHNENYSSPEMVTSTSSCRLI